MAWGCCENFDQFIWEPVAEKIEKPRMVIVNIDKKQVHLRSRPYAEKNYAGVLELQNKGLKPLSPADLVWLEKGSYPQSPLLVREGQVYFVWDGRKYNPPYWTSQGMGIVFDPDGNEPDEFRGKFVIAEVKAIDVTTGRTTPDYDKIIVVKNNDLENLIERGVKSWRVDAKTGLSVPVCRKKYFREDRERRVSSLLRAFAPIAYGGKWSTGNFTLANPRTRYCVWAKMNY